MKEINDAKAQKNNDIEEETENKDAKYDECDAE